ncbi:MAG: PHP domain-containing protein [Gemmatimonadota bacterium]|nr:PHP domain-containing protein [Gemmatimonadota bacterium]
MDSRGAADALNQIAMLLELHGEDRNQVHEFQAASRSVAVLGLAGIAHLLDGNRKPTGEAGASVQVVRELFAENSSTLLESLQEQTPEGLLEMLLVPGLGPAKIRLIHHGLHIDTLADLELAARDGRLASLPRFGEKTAAKIRKGIAALRASGAPMLWGHAFNHAERLRQSLQGHPDVQNSCVAGSIRRCSETVRDIDIVVAVNGAPSLIAAALAHSVPGGSDTLGGGNRTVTVRLDDGVRLDLACVRAEQFALALWRATGSASHVRTVTDFANTRGFTIVGDELRDAKGSVVSIDSEEALYEALGLPFIEPELREGDGELEAARMQRLPELVSVSNIVGAVHCHSHYSDGGATIREMASAAISLGWQYLGISDHSQSNTYAGGLAREQILRQHEEIADINAQFESDGLNFRILQGIEADILPCGRVDYDAQFLDRFDFVIASIHSRYGMGERQMTERVLKSLDDPHITILGHPTGRLLLTREPYAIDMNAVIEKAGSVGVAVELNADPHRVDIDWRLCKLARQHGTMVSIGPDAHSPQGLQNIALGIATARKGWLEPADILNSRTALEVLDFARARRAVAAH